jgi:hypothetical protein
MRLALVGLIVVSACASTAQTVRGPDGEDDWIAITCRRSQANCYEQAGESCPYGYTIADNSGGTQSFAVANAYGGYAGHKYRGEMLIKCKHSGQPAAQSQ